MTLFYNGEIQFGCKYNQVSAIMINNQTILHIFKA